MPKIRGRTSVETGGSGTKKLIYANTNPLYPIYITWYADQGHPTDLIRWGEAVRLEPLGPDSGDLSWGGNQALFDGIRPGERDL